MAGPLETEDGRISEIENLRPTKDHFVATLAGIADRNAAERLANTKLYVPRDRLPEPDKPDEYYHARSGRGSRGRSRRETARHCGGSGGPQFRRRRFDRGAAGGGGANTFLPFDALTVPDVDLTARHLWSWNLPG